MCPHISHAGGQYDVLERSKPRSENSQISDRVLKNLRTRAQVSDRVLKSQIACSNLSTRAHISERVLTCISTVNCGPSLGPTREGVPTPIQSLVLALGCLSLPSQSFGWCILPILLADTFGPLGTPVVVHPRLSTSSF